MSEDFELPEDKRDEILVIKPVTFTYAGRKHFELVDPDARDHLEMRFYEEFFTVFNTSDRLCVLEGRESRYEQTKLFPEFIHELGFREGSRTHGGNKTRLPIWEFLFRKG